MKRPALKHQLKSQAGSKVETVELLRLAHQIEAMELPSLSKSAKSQIADDIGFAYHPYRKTFVRSWAGAMAVLAITVLVFAQSAKPGSALYSTKKVSDKVRTSIAHNVPLLNNSNSDESSLHKASRTTGSDSSNRNSGVRSESGSSGTGSPSGGTGSSTSGSSDSSGDGTHSGSGTSGSGSSGSGSGSGLEQTSTGSTSSGSSGSSGSGGGGGGGSGSDSGSGRDATQTEIH